MTFDMTYLDDNTRRTKFEELFGKTNYSIMHDVFLKNKCYNYLKKLFEIYKEHDHNWKEKFAFYELYQYMPNNRDPKKNNNKYVLKNDERVYSFLYPDDPDLSEIYSGNVFPMEYKTGNDKTRMINHKLDMFRDTQGNFIAGDLEFDNLDTAAHCKLISKRLFYNISGINYRFENWFREVRNSAEFISQVRNSIEGHNNRIDEAALNRKRKFYECEIKDKNDNNINVCDELTKRLEKVVASNAIASVKKAAKTLIDDIRQMKETEDFIVDGVTIPWDYKNNFDIKYLTGYNIFLTPMALVNTGLLNENGNINSDNSFFNYICSFVNRQNEKNKTDDKYNPKSKRGVNFYEADFELFKKLENGHLFKTRFKINSNVIRVLPNELFSSGNTEDNTDLRTDPFVEFFRDKNEKYCIITGSWSTAKAVRELNKSNVIALAISNEQDKLTVYSEKSQNDFEEKLSSFTNNDANSFKNDLISENDQLKKIVNYLEQIKENTNKKPEEEEWLLKLKNYNRPKNNDAVYYDNDFRNQHNIITDGNKYNEGGEGYVFGVAGAPNECIKIYKKDKWREETFIKLHQMLIDNAAGIADNVCFPYNLVYFKNQLIGYNMPRVPEGAKTVYDIIGDPLKTRVTRQGLVRICQRSIETLAKLHEKDILMGDINLKNIMAIKKEGYEDDYDVYFIDVDSYQYGDMLCPVGVDDFASPRILKMRKEGEAQIKRTLEDELFSEAVFIFEILFLNDFPYKTDGDIPAQILAGNYRFRKGTKSNDKNVRDNVNHIKENLSSGITQMFEDIFCDDPKFKNYNDQKIVKLLDDYYYEINPEISDYSHDPEYKCDIKSNLSNELEPSSPPYGIKWTPKKCKSCKRDFWTTSDQKKCTVCRDKEDLQRAEVHFFICPDCKTKFTMNSLRLDDNVEYYEDGIQPDGTIKYVETSHKCYKCEGESALDEKGNDLFSKNGIGNDKLRNAILNYLNACLVFNEPVRINEAITDTDDDTEMIQMEESSNE